jgi:hypothetical protein
MCYIHLTFNIANIYNFNSLNSITLYNITSSKYQTKEWRKSQSWFKTGRSNECEKYQEKILRLYLSKYNLNISKKEANKYRMNLFDNNLIYISEFKKNINISWNDLSFEFSENFDFILEEKNNIILFNLKFICENGGFQIRSLKEVYHFINSQYNFICNHNKQIEKTIYFVNILDGEFCSQNMNKFRFLQTKYIKYLNYSNVFVGDLKESLLFLSTIFQKKSFELDNL